MAMSESQAQAARLDEMTVRGAHRVAIDAARGNLAAPVVFDRVIGMLPGLGGTALLARLKLPASPT